VYPLEPQGDNAFLQKDWLGGCRLRGERRKAYSGSRRLQATSTFDHHDIEFRVVVLHRSGGEFGTKILE